MSWKKDQWIGGRWRVEDTGTQGGECYVFKVWDDLLKETLIARYPRRAIPGEDDKQRHARLRRFGHSVNRWMSLPFHPNVVRGRFVQWVDDKLVFFIDYVDSSVLGYKAGRSAEDTLRLCLDVALGIQHIHRSYDRHGRTWRGMVHRDITPANVLIRSEDGQGILIDLGLALPVDGASTLTGKDERLGEMLGTRDYLPPERRTGKTCLEQEAKAGDVFQFGLIMVEAITNKNYNMVGYSPPPPGILKGHLDARRLDIEKLEQLLLRCIKKEWNQRPGIDEVCRELMAMQIHRGSRPDPASERTLEQENNRAVACRILHRAGFPEMERSRYLKETPEARRTPYQHLNLLIEEINDAAADRAVLEHRWEELHDGGDQALRGHLLQRRHFKQHHDRPWLSVALGQKPGEVYLGDEGGALLRWDRVRGVMERAYQAKEGICALRCEPDMVVWMLTRRTLEQWSPEGGVEVWTHKIEGTPLCLGPNGWGVFQMGDGHVVAAQIDMTGCKDRQRLGRGNEIGVAAFDMQGTLYTVGPSGQVTTYEALGMRERSPKSWPLAGGRLHRHWRALALSAGTDPRYMALCSDAGVQVVDLHWNAQQFMEDHPLTRKHAGDFVEGVKSMCFLRDSLALVTVHDNGLAQVPVPPPLPLLLHWRYSDRQH